MERKEPKLVDMRSIIQRLEALENPDAPANSRGDVQELDERVSELERRVD